MSILCIALTQPLAEKKDFDVTNLNAKPLAEVYVQENLRNQNVKST